MSTCLQIEVLPESASEDLVTMNAVTDLVNEVYATAEQGLWLPGATRTNVREIAELTRAGQIVVARLADVIVGSIRVQRLDRRRARPECWSPTRATEIWESAALRHFVVEKLRREGVKTLQIELLIPRGWTQESKTFMAGWNERAGYEVVRQGAFEEQFPDLAPLLATPCDFIIYNKAL